jgi:beta-phosphoglucomutase
LKKLRVKAVIFDLDGVITNTMPDHYRVWKTIFAQQGIYLSRFDIYQREGQPGLVTVREIFQEHTKAFSLKKAKRILIQKEKQFKKIVKQRFIVGARRFLRDLYRKDITLALVTGTSRHEVHRILPKSLFKLFDVVVTGSDVKHGKPHPEPYRQALKKLKIKKSDAVVIENAPFGIQSARAARLKCFAIETSLPKKYLKGADRIFSSLCELNQEIDWIKK